jgi:deoxyribose-phosphate aldolase
MDWIKSIRINQNAVKRRIDSLKKYRTVQGKWRVAWLLKAVSCIDLTTLAGDDTPGKVKQLCLKAIQPVPKEILHNLGADSFGLTVAAVCVYHNLIPPAIKHLKGKNIPVAAVSTGFPAGQTDHSLKLLEIEKSVASGAKEIDIVISRANVLRGDWQALYDEVVSFRQACGSAHLKTILATGELGTLNNVAKASIVCMMAGADFIKTSTGMEKVNATLPVSLVMVRAIRDYCDKTGFKVGFKPAGGVRTAEQALDWLILVKEELGDEWLNSSLFRFGASGLLGNIEQQLRIIQKVDNLEN